MRVPLVVVLLVGCSAEGCHVDLLSLFRHDAGEVDPIDPGDGSVFDLGSGLTPLDLATGVPDGYRCDPRPPTNRLCPVGSCCSFPSQTCVAGDTADACGKSGYGCVDCTSPGMGGHCRDALCVCFTSQDCQLPLVTCAIGPFGDGGAGICTSACSGGEGRSTPCTDGCCNSPKDTGSVCVPVPDGGVCACGGRGFECDAARPCCSPALVCDRTNHICLCADPENCP